MLSSSLIAESIKDDAERKIVHFFGTEVDLEFDAYSIPEAIKQTVEQNSNQRFFRDKVYYWTVLKKDSTVAIAVLDNVLGKAMPITFMIIFDGSGAILNAHIIKYRESIGGEVSNPAWLNQFNGFNQTDFANSKAKVDGISGATISVRSVSKGFKKLSLLFPEIKLHVNNKLRKR